MRIEQRDLNVLAEVFLSKVVRRDDLIDFGYFSSIARCNSRLLALRRHGLLKQRTDLCGISLREALYTCTPRGLRLASEVLGWNADELKSQYRSSISDLGIRHALACNSLRAKFLRELQVSIGLVLRSWSQEWLCYHEFELLGARTSVRPDALAVMSLHGQQSYVFIEADLGNASLPKIQQMLCRYDAYLTSGAFEEVYGAKSFVVSFVTTDERRLSNVRRLSVAPWLATTTWKRLALASLSEAVFSSSGPDRVALKEVLS